MVTDAMIKAAQAVPIMCDTYSIDREDAEAIYLAMHAARPTADLGEDGELARAIYEALLGDGGDAYMDAGEYLESVTLDGTFDL